MMTLTKEQIKFATLWILIHIVEDPDSEQERLEAARLAREKFGTVDTDGDPIDWELLTAKAI